ncbi:hypothetical protein MKW98_012717 [Papaver atlanticum]|uniref:FBD domain-containing protein n=1 Tax=Papaver atlanticum TaxID=357466 RepID=A0AAD4XLK0_9MAGN|nr:hypothetical protein MKW98_012717 [Papaver atlanticum]
MVILELDTWDPVILPDATNFSNIKICRLRNAILHVYSEDLKQHFFSNVLVLEELELTDCQWSKSDQLIIDFGSCDYILHHFGSLVDAEIDFKRFDIPLPQEKDPTATKALKELSNVKRLKISGETFQISFSKDKTLLSFLRISPNLKTIIIAKGFVGHQYSTDSGWTPDMVPQCVLLHLKSVEFCEFYGCLEELNAVKTILKNARVLRRMVIKFPLLFSTDKQNKVMKKLLKFSRSSKSCIIEIS